jgi:hypothetical protein
MNGVATLAAGFPTSFSASSRGSPMQNAASVFQHRFEWHPEAYLRKCGVFSCLPMVDVATLGVTLLVSFLVGSLWS